MKDVVETQGRGATVPLPANIAPDSLVDEEPNLADLDFASAVAHGLSLRPRRLGSKWLYDARGALLFEEIVASPHYYLGRTEMSLLRTHAAEVAGMLGPEGSLVELGSGSSTKVRILLAALERPRCYIPVEISAEQLQQAAAAIRHDFPHLAVRPLATDYTREFVLPRDAEGRRLLAYFPGSTLCNLLPHNSVAFLRRMAGILGPDSLFLAGVDLRKDEAVLLRAYNDPGGAIWRFNLNIVERLNRELDAGLDPAAFRHEARYDRHAGRIEAAIYPLRDQNLTVAGRSVTLPAEQPIILEYSHKYSVEGFRSLAREAGWTPLRAWTDAGGLFSLHLLRCGGEGNG